MIDRKSQGSACAGLDSSSAAERRRDVRGGSWRFRRGSATLGWSGTSLGGIRTAGGAAGTDTGAGILECTYFRTQKVVS